VHHLNIKGIIFHKRIIWRLHAEIIEGKAFRTFTIVYSLFESERLSPDIKITLHKAIIRSVMTSARSALEFATGIYLPFETTMFAKEGYPQNW
jgi:hypothetical protein